MAKRNFVLANNPLLSGPALDERERGGVPYREISLSAIDRDPNQPRKVFDEDRLQELANSIRTYGVLTPILVRPAATPGRYVLIAGERRVRASELAGRTSIPAMIDQGGADEHDRTLAMQLVENIQRADLSPLERAHAIGALRDHYTLSVREIAERLGISKSMVQRSLEILELPDDLLNALRDGASESKVLLLAKIDDVEIRASYLKELDVLTRGQLEKDLQRRKVEAESMKPGLVSPEDRRIADDIQRALGLRVKLQRVAPNEEAGKLTVEFYSEQDLQELYRKLVSD
jgi:ParB family chromosome partitioning protein